jgi:hypothetical protein
MRIRNAEISNYTKKLTEIEQKQHVLKTNFYKNAPLIIDYQVPYVALDEVRL